MTTTADIIRALEDGPALSREIAAEIGTATRDACTRLNSLHRQGRIVREQVRQRKGTRGPRMVSMWRLQPNDQVQP